jgi:hypothetical protein
MVQTVIYDDATFKNLHRHKQQIKQRKGSSLKPVVTQIVPSNKKMKSLSTKKKFTLDETVVNTMGEPG